jgi:hypothetical protein
MWHFHEKTEFSSKNFAPRALNLVTDMDSSGLTTSKSRVVGTAIQFVHPSGYLARRERYLEEELERKGVSVRSSNMYTLTGEKTLSESYPYSDFVTDEEWEAEDFGQRSKFSLPKPISHSIEVVCNNSEDYNLKQKARFVSDAIIAFDRSVFRDLVERVETKEQLLRVVRGEDVEEPTKAFENIRDGVWFESVGDVVFSEELDLEAIDPEDEVELPSDHPVVTGEETLDSLGVAQGKRAGPFVAFLRSMLIDGGLPEPQLVGIFKKKNTDYSHPKSAVRNNVIPHLHKGPDGRYYLTEDNVPEKDATGRTEEERRETLAELVKAMSTGPSGRSIKAGVRDAVGADEVDRVRGPEEPSGFQASTMAVEMDTSELQRVLKYLVDNVSKSHQEQVAREECGLQSEDYVFLRDSDF